MKSVVFNGVRLVPGSRALELHQAGLHKELQAHMREVHQAAVKRGEILEPAMKWTPWDPKVAVDWVGEPVL